MVWAEEAGAEAEEVWVVRRMCPGWAWKTGEL